MPEKAPAPHWLGHRERLRRRLTKRGPAALDDYELLEIILFATIPRKDVKPIAKALLTRFGSISAILTSDTDRLTAVPGIGSNTVATLQAIREIGARASRETLMARPLISGWAALLGYVRSEMQHETREQFRSLFLDRKNQLIADEIMWTGTIDHAPVYPREIARRALELSAASVILVHNHPTGDPTPSRADIDSTREIIDALSALDINVHDHLIVGRQGITSFKSSGLI